MVKLSSITRGPLSSVPLGGQLWQTKAVSRLRIPNATDIRLWEGQKRKFSVRNNRLRVNKRLLFCEKSEEFNPRSAEFLGQAANAKCSQLNPPSQSLQTMRLGTLRKAVGY